MMQVVKKWKVVVLRSQAGMPEKDVVFFVHDNFLSNVLRTVASLDFCEGTAQPFGFNINEVPLESGANVTVSWGDTREKQP